jgi:methionyl-tRNA formyltransferase
MDIANKRIIFLGTPDFAVATLKALVEAGLQVVAVVTMPDKAAGRGLKLQESPVKRYALTQGIPVLQPVKLKSPDFLAELASYQADIQVVVAFRMLPEAVWDMPPLGTYNLHASLLPQYRGAAPINWAIIHGEQETGITTFKLKHAIDTGDIVHRASHPIGPDTTAGDLHDALMLLGAKWMVKTVKEVLSGEAKFLPQDGFTTALRAAPKLFKADCHIDWQKSGQAVHNLIRGLSPYPAAFTLMAGQVLKIYKGNFKVMAHADSPGICRLQEKGLQIATGDGYYFPEEVQIEGKKRMSVADFLRGYRAESAEFQLT